MWFLSLLCLLEPALGAALAHARSSDTVEAGVGLALRVPTDPVQYSEQLPLTQFEILICLFPNVLIPPSYRALTTLFRMLVKRMDCSSWANLALTTSLFLCESSSYSLH